MEVVLLENIKNLGKIGDIVIVKRGHARNFLIKYEKALKASKDNISLVNKKKEDLNSKNLTLKKEAKKIFDVINIIDFNLLMSIFYKTMFSIVILVYYWIIILLHIILFILFIIFIIIIIIIIYYCTRSVFFLISGKKHLNLLPAGRPAVLELSSANDHLKYLIAPK